MAIATTSLSLCKSHHTPRPQTSHPLGIKNPWVKTVKISVASFWETIPHFLVYFKRLLYKFTIMQQRNHTSNRWSPQSNLSVRHRASHYLCNCSGRHQQSPKQTRTETKFRIQGCSLSKTECPASSFHQGAQNTEAEGEIRCQGVLAKEV